MNFPLLNAYLNASSAIVLVAGLAAIKRDRRKLHERLMLAAAALSIAFLTSYLYYHFAIKLTTPFRRSGWIKSTYLLLLVSHVILAMVNLPLVLITLSFAWRQRWEQHKRWAQWTFPIWLYVSVTGVIVYLALYVWNPEGALS